MKKKQTKTKAKKRLQVATDRECEIERINQLLALEKLKKEKSIEKEAGQAKVKQFNGKISLRLPRGLHRKSIQLAQTEGVTLNHFLSSLIAFHMGTKQ